MGGNSDSHHPHIGPYPKWVWATTGGWHPYPAKWRKNTLVLGLWMIALSIPVFIYSCNNERVIHEPRGWVPSMLWSKEMKEIEKKRQ